MNRMYNDLTFVVPSMDGLERLKLLCCWLQNQRFDGKLLIVDGSAQSQAHEFAKINFVRYHHLPGSSAQAAQYKGYKIAETEFVALLGDDDLPALDGCFDCLEFLRKTDEFDAAHGSASFIDFDSLLQICKSDKDASLWNSLKVIFAGRYDRYSDYSQLSAQERLSSFRKNYTVLLFCICRTSRAKIVNNEILATFDDVHLGEICSSLGMALTCRIKLLPTHFLFRGLGAHRPNSKVNEPRHLNINFEQISSNATSYINHLSGEKGLIKEAVSSILYFRLRGLMKAFDEQAESNKYFSGFYIHYQIRRVALLFSNAFYQRIKIIRWLASIEKN